MLNIWNWMKYEKDIMLQPSTECPYLSERWLSYDKKNLLDLGCGLGPNSIYFAIKGFNVTSVDISDYAIKYVSDLAKKNKVRINAICGDFYEIDFEKDEFDCVFLRNVVSKQTKAQFKKLLNRITKLLRTGGELYITIPSKNSWEYKKLQESKSRAKNNSVYMDFNDIRETFKDYDFVNDIEEKVFYDKYCNVEDVESECKTYYFSLLLKKK